MLIKIEKVINKIVIIFLDYSQNLIIKIIKIIYRLKKYKNKNNMV